MQFWQLLLLSNLFREEEDGTGSGEAPTTSEATEAPAEGEGEEGSGNPPSEGEASPEPEAPKRRPWFEQRIGQLSAQKREKEEENLRLRQELEAIRRGKSAAEEGDEKKPVSADAVERLATEKALQIAQGIAAQQAFAQRCNAVAMEGQKEFTDFGERVQLINQVAGGAVPDEFLEAVLETDKPHSVLYALGADPEKAMEILSLPPIKQAAALVKFEAQMSKPKPRSKAPAPITPQVGGGGKTTTSLDDTNLPIDQWMKLRNKQLEGNRR
jgi:hypothetical protein